MKNPLLCIVLLLLSGCATYHPHPVAPAALMAAFEARTLDSPELRRYIDAHCGSGVCAPGVWNLQTLTLAAFYFSPLLDSARARYGSSQAAIQSAGERPNPALKFPLGYTANAKSGESPYTFGLGLDIPIETAGKRGYRLTQARQISNAARSDIGTVAWQVRSRLRGHMLGFYAATRRARILERQIVTQQEIAAMLDKRLAVGAASAPEA
ncbi:MAG: TolC family protein, partial [Proteobacteria bacterium]|nr:TolC family protein [Pseudomonadota bacterium]